MTLSWEPQVQDWHFRNRLIRTALYQRTDGQSSVGSSQVFVLYNILRLPASQNSPHHSTLSLVANNADFMGRGLDNYAA